MESYFKRVAAWVGVLACATMIGCGGGESQGDGQGDGEVPPASIPGTPETATGNAGPESTPQPTQEQLHPKVVIDTSQGQITVELDAENAPLTTDNFLTYVDDLH